MWRLFTGFSPHPDEHGIEHIDLLKINVEKSEFGALAGIREDHWQRIYQVVLKGNIPDAVTGILQMLERHGFETIDDQGPAIEGSRVQTVTAVATRSRRHA